MMANVTKLKITDKNILFMFASLFRIQLISDPLPSKELKKN